VVFGGFGELGNFPWGVDLGHCFRWFWVVLGELCNFLLWGFDFRALCRWFWVVLGESGNFSLWGVDLGHFVGGFEGVRQFFFMGS
jgi:hypothetical protein